MWKKTFFWRLANKATNTSFLDCRRGHTPEYIYVDSGQSRGEEVAPTMGKPGETLPLQAHDEFLESRQESCSPSQTNIYKQSDDDDREQHLFSPIPFVRSCRSGNSSSSCSRQPWLSIATSFSGAGDDPMDSDEDFIDSPSDHYASLNTPRNSPTNGEVKRYHSCISWLALTAGAGLAILCAAVFWGGNGGNVGPQKTAGTEQMNTYQKMNDPLQVTPPPPPPPPSSTAASKDTGIDDTKDEASEDIDDSKDAYDKNNQVSNVIEERFQTKLVPPLSELVVGNEIRGNVDWMIDFAIIGNPKCGTTFLMVRLISLLGSKVIHIFIGSTFFISHDLHNKSPTLIPSFSTGSLALTILMCTMARCVL
jgi:hypothetical protein